MHEIVSEQWWDDLPDNCLEIMGYHEEGEQVEDHTDLETTISNLRNQGKGRPTAL